jgi:hypothetical protein
MFSAAHRLTVKKTNNGIEIVVPEQSISPDIPWIPGSRKVIVCLLRLRDNAFRRQSHVVGSRSDVFPSGERESGWFCLHQDAALPLWSITFDPCAAHAGADGARSRAMSNRISWNICRGTATSAVWKVTYRPWLMTLAPILISFSRRLVSDHVSTVFGLLECA